MDKKTNKRIAKNVRLTDETIPGMNGDQTGILDVVVLRYDTACMCSRTLAPSHSLFQCALYARPCVVVLCTVRCLYYLYMIRHWNKCNPFFFNTLPLILFPFSCSCIPLTYSCTPTPEPDGLDLSGAYLATRNCSGIQADQRHVLIRTICKKVRTYSFYLLAWLTIVSAFFLFCHSRLSLSVSLSLFLSLRTCTVQAEK